MLKSASYIELIRNPETRVQQSFVLYSLTLFSWRRRIEKYGANIVMSFDKGLNNQA